MDQCQEFRVLVSAIDSHRVMTHAVFQHLKIAKLEGREFGGFFDQVQHFCAATRAAHALPKGLRRLGLEQIARYIEKIEESEAGHGEELATMIAYLMNFHGDWHPDLDDRGAIEHVLRTQCSDVLFSDVPGYETWDGVLHETRCATEVFEHRKMLDPYLIAYSLGVTLALEMVSHGHLIPGEIAALVEPYGVSLDATPMHYLKEHGDEGGAEKEHEELAIRAVQEFIESQCMDPDARAQAMQRGAKDFCDRLATLWDTLDLLVLQGGYRSYC